MNVIVRIVDIEIYRLDGKFGEIIISHYDIDLKSGAVFPPLDNDKITYTAAVPPSHRLLQASAGQ
jgi:hypothetical protein